MEFITGTYTDIGATRKENQDAFAVMEADTEKGKVCMAIICDGMGGLSKGELASATLIKAFERWFEEKMPGTGISDLIAIKESWLDELSFWSERLKKYGVGQQILLGSTFSGMLFIENQYLWVHVGDSRIYRMHDFGIEQISKDDTALAREMARGTITPEEAKHSKLNNKLTQCIGASKSLKPQFGTGVVKKGEGFLLCTDGFYHQLSEKEMLKAQQNCYQTEQELNDFCQQAVRTVIQRGEKDNVSVIVLKCK